MTYSSFKPGSFNQSVFEHPCQVESISKPSGGFDASEFARHLDMDGDSRIFVPKMKMEVIVVVFFFFFFFLIKYLNRISRPMSIGMQKDLLSV